MYKEQKRNKAIIIFLGLFFLFILNNVVYADFEWENIEHYKTSVKELSFLKDIWLKEDFLIYKQAKDSFLKKKYAKTILFCDKLIKKEYLPILDEIFYYMAFSYYHLKEYSKGLDIIKRISMDGLSDDLHFQFLDLQFDIYKKNKILNVLKKKLELKLQSKKIKDLKIKDLYNFFLAKIYENQYFLKEAFFYYIEAIKLKTKAAEENFIKEVLLKIRYLYRSSYLNNFEKKELMNLIIDEFMKYDKFDLIESYNFIKRYTEDIPKNFFLEDKSLEARQYYNLFFVYYEFNRRKKNSIYKDKIIFYFKKFEENLKWANWNYEKIFYVYYKKFLNTKTKEIYSLYENIFEKLIHNKKKPYILLEEILEYYHRETFDEKKIDYYLHFLVNVNLELFKAYFFIHLENQRFQFLVDKIIPIGLKFSDKETINEFQYWMGILQFNLKNYSLSQEYFLKSYLSYTSYYSFKSFLYMKEFYKENYFKISPEEVKSLRDKKRSEFLRSNLFIKRYQETYPFLFKKENFLKLKVYPHLLRLMYFSYFDIASEEEKKEYKFFTNESCENQAHLYRSLVYYFYSIAHYQYGINFSNKLVYCFNKNLYGFYIPAELYMFSYPILFESMLKDLEKEYKVNLFLILSIMRRESRFMQELKSTSSAIGVMQIIPSTGKYIREKLNLKNLFIENKIDNIKMGVHYFSFLKDKFDGLNIFALASYNAGPGRIQFWMKKAEKNIPFILNMEHFIDRVILAKETRLYIKSIYLYYYNYLRIYNQEIN